MILGDVLSASGGGGLLPKINVKGLLSTDSVVATKDGKTKQSKWAKTSVLPSGYTQLEYIYQFAGRYGHIDTNFKPNQDTKTEVSVEVIDTGGYWFGCWNTAYNNGAYAVGNDGGGLYAGYDGQGGTSGSVVSVGNHIISLDKNIVYVDGAIVRTFSTATFQLNYNLYLFGRCDAGTTTRSGNVKMYYAKIWDNGSLIRHYIPAKRNSDNVIGMYDIVNSVFYESVGTDSLMAGPVSEGIWQIIVDDFGTWSVTATRGSDGKTKIVDIFINTVREYDIDWTWVLYLYNKGDECEDITGGWKTCKFVSYFTESGTATKESNALYVRTPSNTTITKAFQTINAIDISSYTNMFVEVSYHDDYGYRGMSMSTNSGYHDGDNWKQSLIIGINEMPLSDKSSAGYYATIGTWYNAVMRVSRIWLE